MEIKLNSSTKKIGQSILGFLKKRPNMILFALLLAAVLAVGMVFYNYVLKTPDFSNEEQIVKVNQQLYQQIIDRLDARETNIQQGTAKSYPDVFR